MCHMEFEDNSTRWTHLPCQKSMWTPFTSVHARLRRCLRLRSFLCLCCWSVIVEMSESSRIYNRQESTTKFVTAQHLLFSCVLLISVRCPILCCSVSLYFVLFYSILFGSFRLYSVLLCSVLFFPVLFDSIMFCSILLGSILFSSGSFDPLGTVGTMSKTTKFSPIRPTKVKN